MLNRQDAKDAKGDKRMDETRKLFDPERIGVQNQWEPTTQEDELARAVIGAAIEVHRTLGPGYLEAIYEEALAIELTARQIPFERQARIHLQYKGQQLGESRLDFLIGGLLIVELKAVESHHPLFEAQVLSYLKATNLRLGLLLNFNVPVMKNGIKRIVRSTS